MGKLSVRFFLIPKFIFFREAITNSNTNKLKNIELNAKILKKILNFRHIQVAFIKTCMKEKGC